MFDFRRRTGQAQPLYLYPESGLPIRKASHI
jgi:hypothetical protein